MMRDGIGAFCLVLAVFALIALVVGLARPRSFARPGPDGSPTPPRPRTIAVIFGPIAAVLLIASWLLLVAPSYSVQIQPDGQIVAAPGTTLLAKVTNEGMVAGSFEAPLTLDGRKLTDISVKASGGATTTAELPLPDDLTAGRHTAGLGGVSYAFTALTPPEYRVGKLNVQPPVAKVRAPITVSVTVRNVGEADGVFPGVLKVNGKQAATTDAPIAGRGGSRSVSFEFKQPSPGRCRLDVEGSKATAMVVKPVRLSNGTVLANSIGGGVGKLILDNRYRDDCMVCLTATKSSRTPLLSAYIHGRSKATISGLRDGDYYAFFSVGKDWNHFTNDFLTSYTRSRFTKPVPFSTRHWTSSYTDYAAWTIWTTYHTQYTRFTLVLGSSKGTDPGVLVGEKAFPTPR